MADDLDPSEARDRATEPYYAAIGRLATTWSELDGMLQRQVWQLTGMDRDEGLCVTAQMGGPARCLDAIIALCQLNGADKDTIRRMNVLYKRVGDLQRHRNRIIHDIWLIQAGEIAIRVEHSKTMPAFKLESYDLARLENILTDMVDLYGQLTSAIPALTALPGKPHKA